MPADISEIDLPPSYRLYLINLAASLRKMADKDSKNAQARLKKDYDKHVLFEPRVAAGDHVFSERPPLMEFPTDRRAYK